MTRRLASGAPRQKRPLRAVALFVAMSVAAAALAQSIAPVRRTVTATGAAAAALGAYLRELGLITPPATLTILQGEDMGRPSRLLVDVDPGRVEIDVTGTAVPIT